MAIPRTFIDDLIARSAIEDVVGDYVQLKRRGNDLWGLCPFHSEKSPSFHVTPDRGQYHCFGCGKGGGVVNFIMDSENLDFVDAVHFLARRYGLTVPEDGEGAERTQNRHRTLELIKDAARYFHEQLKISPVARAYLEKRRIEWKTAVRFGLGYAPDGWNSLTDEMRRKGYNELEMFTAGLTVKSQKGGFRDKFYNRLMFPVIDQKGQVIAFGGRVLGDGEPKYLNSPEIPNIFSKRRVLYGINLAKNTKRDYFILCEGNIDVISLHQAGFDNAVASMGTSLTQEQISLMAQLRIKEVIVCYDSDNAGIKATDRAMQELAKSNIKLSVVRIPDGKDVDEFIKTHGDAGAKLFNDILDNRKNDVSYRLERLEAEYDLTQDDQRVTYLRGAIELLASFDAVQREIAAFRVAETAKVQPEFVAAEAEKAAKRSYYQNKRSEERQLTRPVRSFQDDVRRSGVRYSNPKSAAAEEGIIRILMLDPQLIAGAAVTPDEFTSPELGGILSVIQSQVALPNGSASLQAELTPEEMALLVRITDKEENLANSKEILADYIAAVRRERIMASGNIEDLIAAKKEQLG